MRKFLIIFTLLALGAGVFYSCKKYSDPAPGNDPRLTRPYCNDPLAVNYNWDFPGKPDNTTCFYPSDLFAGTYYCRDTVTSGVFLSADSFFVEILASSTDKSKITVRGDFCGPGSNFIVLMTANVSYSANVDTTAGDSTTLHNGQLFCHPYDTLTGTISRDRASDSVIFLSFQVYSDTASYTITGRAVKQK